MWLGCVNRSRCPVGRLLCLSSAWVAGPFVPRGAPRPLHTAGPAHPQTKRTSKGLGEWRCLGCFTNIESQPLSSDAERPVGHAAAQAPGSTLIVSSPYLRLRPGLALPSCGPGTGASVLNGGDKCVHCPQCDRARAVGEDGTPPGETGQWH